MSPWAPVAVLWIIAGILLLLPCLVFSAEILGAVTGRRRVFIAPSDRPTLAVIVPAHDEAPIIADTVRAIRTQLSAADRLLVVADNCIDDTAALAAAEQAEVLVRIDQSRRGKGYALDFAVRHLESSRTPAVVIVIDADCEVTAGLVDRLARLCTASARPVQARYRLRAPPQASATLRLKEFACAVKNEARPLGLHRWGLPCQLFGSGMAFPWERIRSASLATGHLVEDLQLGIELARSGCPALFCPDAELSSELPATPEGMQSQRTRWEHGYLSTMLRDGPGLLLGSLFKGNWLGVALAVDLMVPPLALLVLLIALHWLSSLLLWEFSGRLAPLLLSTLAGVLLAFSVLLAWRRFGRSSVSLSSLLQAARYTLAKTPLYGRFLGSRQQEWIRSRRNHET